jgi:hypothetical protein
LFFLREEVWNVSDTGDIQVVQTQAVVGKLAEEF